MNKDKIIEKYKKLNDFNLKDKLNDLLVVKKASLTPETIFTFDKE